MIKNERQYRMTKAQANTFTRALRELRGEGKRTAHPVLHKAQIDALRSQLADLSCELTEYEGLRSGKQKVLTLTSLADLPKTLIQGRIAAGLSQEKLAAKLGVKPQQVQRYEAAEYQSASLARVNDVARALGIELRHRAQFRLAS